MTRRIGFIDPETGKRLIFLTNHFALPAVTIAALHKRRWQIELICKWIKQKTEHTHPPFLRNIRERCEDANLDGAVCLYALAAIVKKLHSKRDGFTVEVYAGRESHADLNLGMRGRDQSITRPTPTYSRAAGSAYLVSAR